MHDSAAIAFASVLSLWWCAAALAWIARRSGVVPFLRRRVPASGWASVAGDEEWDIAAALDEIVGGIAVLSAHVDGKDCSTTFFIRGKNPEDSPSIKPKPGSPPSREQMADLLARVKADGLVATNGQAEAVFEADAGRTPFFALVSPRSSTNAEQRVWSAFLWDGAEWTAAPTNGFECASGRCPSTIIAGANDFYPK